MSAPSITLRYIDVNAIFADFPPLVRLCPSDELKDAALTKLGIERPPGQPHLTAWTLAMCRENGLPAALPSTAIGDAVLESPAVRSFVWWLA